MSKQNMPIFTPSFATYNVFPRPCLHSAIFGQFVCKVNGERSNRALSNNKTALRLSQNRNNYAIVLLTYLCVKFSPLFNERDGSVLIRQGVLVVWKKSAQNDGKWREI